MGVCMCVGVCTCACTSVTKFSFCGESSDPDMHCADRT